MEKTKPTSEAAVQRFHGHCVRKDNLWRQALRCMAMVQQDTIITSRELELKLSNAARLQEEVLQLRADQQSMEEESQSRIKTATVEIVRLQKQIAQTSAELARERQLKTASEEQVKQLIVKVKEGQVLQNELRDAHREDLAAAREELSSATADLKKKALKDKEAIKEATQAKKEIEKLKSEQAEKKKLFHERLKKLQKQNDAMRKALDTQNKEKEDISGHFWHLTKETKALKKELAETLKRDDGMTTKLRGEIESLKGKLSKVEIELRQTKAKESHQSALLLDRALAAEKNLKLKIAAAAEAKAQAAEENATLRAKLADLRTQIDGSESSLQKEQRRIQELELKIRQQDKHSKGEIASLKQELAGAEDEYFGETERLKENLENHERRMAKLDSDKKEMTIRLQGAAVEIEKQKAQIIALKQVVRDAELMLQQKTDDAELLKGQLARHRSAASTKTTALEESTRKAKGEISGLSQKVALLTASLTKEKEARGIAERKSEVMVQRIEKGVENVKQLEQALKSSEDSLARMTRQAEQATDKAEKELENHRRAANKKLENVESELLKLKNLLTNKTSIVTALENEKRDLIKEVDSLSRQLLDIAKQQRKAEQEAGGMARDAKLTEERLHEEVRQRQELEKELESQNKVLSLERRQHKAEVGKLMKAIEEVRNSFKISQRQAAEQVASFSQRMQLISAQSSNETEKNEALRSEVRRQQAIADAATVELEKSNSKILSLEQKHRQDMKRLNERIENLRATAAMSDKKLNDEKREKLLAEEKLNDALGRIRNLSARVVEVEAEMKSFEKTVIHAKKKQEEAEKKSSAAKNLPLQIEKLNAALKAQQEKVQKAEIRVEAIQEKAREEASQLRKELHRRETALASTTSKAVALEQRVRQVQEDAKMTVTNMTMKLKATEGRFALDVERLRGDAESQRQRVRDLREDQDRQSQQLHQQLSTCQEELKRERTRSNQLQTKLDRTMTMQKRQEEELGGALRELRILKENIKADSGRIASATKAQTDAEDELNALRASEIERTAKWKSVQEKLVQRLEAAESELKASQAQMSWSKNDSKVRLNAIEQEAEELKATLARRDEESRMMRKKLDTARQIQQQLQQAANESIATLRKDLQNVVSRKSDEEQRVRKELEMLRAVERQLNLQNAKLTKRLKQAERGEILQREGRERAENALREVRRGGRGGGIGLRKDQYSPREESLERDDEEDELRAKKEERTKQREKEDQQIQAQFDALLSDRDRNRDHIVGSGDENEIDESKSKTEISDLRAQFEAQIDRWNDILLPEDQDDQKTSDDSKTWAKEVNIKNISTQSPKERRARSREGGTSEREKKKRPTSGGEVSSRKKKSQNDAAGASIDRINKFLQRKKHSAMQKKADRDKKLMMVGREHTRPDNGRRNGPNRSKTNSGKALPNKKNK
eukprot:g2380.t1